MTENYMTIELDKTGLYAERPKSLRELYKILLNVGTRPNCIVDITEALCDTRHCAPAGQTPNWSKPQKLPCLVGTMVSDVPLKYQSAFKRGKWLPYFNLNYYRYYRPSQNNPCIHARGHSARDTVITWDMYIFCDDVPELMKEWRDLHVPVIQSQEKLEVIRNKIRDAIQKATEEIQTKFGLRSAELDHSLEIKKVRQYKMQIVEETQKQVEETQKQKERKKHKKAVVVAEAEADHD